VTSALGRAITTGQDMKGLVMTSLVQVNVTGVCGNSICEVGEMADISDPLGHPGTCPSDCPLAAGQRVRDTFAPPLACPVPSGSAVASETMECGGRGICNSASGVCSCNAGYVGPDCSECAQGYQPLNGTCTSQAEAMNTTYLPSAEVLHKPSPQKDDDWSMVIIIAAAAGGCLIVCAVVVGLLLWRRARRMHNEATRNRAPPMPPPRRSLHQHHEGSSLAASSSTQSRVSAESFEETATNDKDVKVTLVDDDPGHGRTYDDSVHSEIEHDAPAPQSTSYPRDIAERLG
jgi:hypothetical protein